MEKTWLALLRGINVGGNCILPMKALTSIFTDAGASGVKTYIQSGNVIFKAADPDSISTKVTNTIAAEFGYAGRVVLLSRAELLDAYKNNPFATAGALESSLHVYFLADTPHASDVKALDPLRSAPDAFAVRKRAVYLHLPNGMARTKLSNVYFDRQLKTVSTARNWKTVAKLVEMMG